jgi:prevent-host-death family protein
MKSKDAQRCFGGMVDTARNEPVTITRNDRPTVVVIDHAYFERLVELEDEMLAMQARAAAASGYLGTEKSAEVLREMLNAD